MNRQGAKVAMKTRSLDTKDTEDTKVYPYKIPEMQFLCVHRVLRVDAFSQVTGHGSRVTNSGPCGGERPGPCAQPRFRRA